MLFALIPALISGLLFAVSDALFSVPGVLFGQWQEFVAVLCVVGGVILLIPAAAEAVMAIVNFIGKKRTGHKG